ncbi:MAG: hypothetical protein IH597_12370 [Bacteroidales bacterium]|nr:hypothetical protein [Bacteroidales bacterium]
MKNNIYYIITIKLLLATGVISYAQGVAISDSITSTPDPSAILDLQSSHHGFLPPRLNTLQMNAIENPPAGLMVYNTTVNSLMWFNGSRWFMGVNMDGTACGTVEYDSRTYTTIIIGSQCWMRENLDAGTMIIGNITQTNNEIVEKYCYNNDQANCLIFGGLYQWGEAIQYETAEGARGICPIGWHIPADGEWKELEGYVDSQYSIADPIWDNTGWRGNDAGKHLKSVSGWVTNEGLDSYGFFALPGGFRLPNSTFSSISSYGSWWTSSESEPGLSLQRNLFHFFNTIERKTNNPLYGYSVRCIKD